MFDLALPPQSASLPEQNLNIWAELCFEAPSRPSTTIVTLKPLPFSSREAFTRENKIRLCEWGNLSLT